jgi:outer membrane immunogenic protein
MKKNPIFILLAGSLLLSGSKAMAATEGDTYLGFQYSLTAYDEKNITQEFNPTAAIVRLGMFLNPNFAIEGRLGTGVQDDTEFLSGLGSGNDATLELDQIAGVYLTGHLSLADAFSLYGLLGGSVVKGTASLPSISGLELSESNSGISYGVGADIYFLDNLALNAELIRYLDRSDFDLDAVSLGISYRF